MYTLYTVNNHIISHYNDPAIKARYKNPHKVNRKNKDYNKNNRKK